MQFRIGDIFTYSPGPPYETMILLSIDSQEDSLVFDCSGTRYETGIIETEEDVEDGFLRCIGNDYGRAQELIGRYAFAQSILVLCNNLDALAEEVIQNPRKIEEVRSLLAEFKFPSSEDLPGDRWEMLSFPLK